MVENHKSQMFAFDRFSYDEDRMKMLREEEPFLNDVLRSFECSACCTERLFEDAETNKLTSLRPYGMYDDIEEPVGSVPSSPPTESMYRSSIPTGPADCSRVVADLPTPTSGRNSPSGTDALSAILAEEKSVAAVTAAPWRDHSPLSGAGVKPPREDGEDCNLEDRLEVEVERGYFYTGQWCGDARHGNGTLRHPDGVRYVGRFANNRAHGRGVFTGSDGCSYEGVWEDDQMNGYGKYVDSDGSTYEGEWIQDSKSGRGVESYTDGARYEGEFYMGGKHGAGIYRGNNGVEFEGQYAHDKMDGEGRYKFADGRQYSGQWAVGHMQGYGKMMWPNGSRYEGGYQQDRKHGEGTFTWPDGRMYHGQWRNGQLDGSGVLVSIDGEEEQQEWVNGERLGGQAERESV